MHEFAQQLLVGLQVGSIYALIALGYTMVYGVLKLINFAHGDVYMVGAYAGLGGVFILGNWLPGHAHLLSLIPSPLGAILVLLIAMIAGALLGLIIEQAAYRPLRTRAWVAPAIFLGAASGYVARGIALDQAASDAAGTAAGIVVWVLIAALLFVSQKRRKADQSTRLTALITAIGVSLFIENFSNLPGVFTPDTRFFPVIVNLPNTIGPRGAGVQTATLVIFFVSIVLALALTYVVKKTKIGKAIRAVSFDIDAAALMGINTDRVIAFTFALGASLAGAAGVMVQALSGTSFNPYVGIQIGLKAFVAAVLGGIGNIPGAMVGGLIMGIAETMVVAYGPSVHIPSTYRDAVAFFLLILILLVKPAGLLGRYVPEKV
jgi:branched-chain amino acid transport system permease protein